MVRLLAAAALGALLASGCIIESYDSGALLCDQGGGCPNGQLCDPGSSRCLNSDGGSVEAPLCPPEGAQNPTTCPLPCRGSALGCCTGPKYACHVDGDCCAFRSGRAYGCDGGSCACLPTGQRADAPGYCCSNSSTANVCL